MTMNLQVDWASQGRALAFVAVALVLMMVAKLIADRLTRYDDDAEIREGANGALALRRAGMYLGLAIGLGGALLHLPAGGMLGPDLSTFALYGGSVVVLMLVAQVLNEAVMLRGMNTHDAIKGNNLAVGTVEFGQFVATGVIAAGALTGDGAFWTSALFMALGQVGLLLGFVLYARFVKWSVREELAGGNVAAGLLVGARLIALGVIVSGSISGDNTTLANDLLWCSLYYVYGTLLLAAVSWIADLLFLPKVRIHEMIEKRNVAGIGVVSAITLAAAMVVWASH
ncbi:DUF350 domain-containing protein [bacterium]|nr:MAG: DUF350 domain-containing protein [bacterium]